MVALRSFWALGLLAGTAVAKFDYVGINEAGPEFGEKKIPGVLNKDYVWPNQTSVKHFIQKGMNTFRLNILMERLISKPMTKKKFEGKYFQDLKSFVDSTTKAGAYAMICPHNYGRYYGQVITDPSSFKAFWTTLAAAFKDNPRVIWDTNNEYNTMDQGLVVRLNQAAIDGIRSTGAKQPIHVEGNHWSGAWTWTTTKYQNAGETNAQSMLRLKDPQNKLVYHMHQYLDTDGSGTHKECVSSTIGAERLRAATAWLKQNRKVGFIGEFAGGDNAQCKTAIEGMLRYMQQNSDVWKGWAWWSAGPWWGPYMYSMEPKDGLAYKPYIDLIMKYR